MKRMQRFGALALVLALLVSGLPEQLVSFVYSDSHDVAVAEAAVAKPANVKFFVKKKDSKHVTVKATWDSNAAYEEFEISYDSGTGAKTTAQGSGYPGSFSHVFEVAEGLNYSYTFKVRSVNESGQKSSWVKKTKKYRLVGKATKKVKKVIKNNIKSSWSDYEKVKYVHDWMVKNLKYDESSNPNYFFSDTILEKKGVCQGYSETFMVFMQLLGIPVTYVPSVDEGNHAWNIVKVGKKWYNMDVTWDDPVGMDSVTNTYPVYDYFLQSTGNFRQKATAEILAHTPMSKTKTCSDTKYDNDGSKTGYFEAVPGDTSGIQYGSTFHVWMNGTMK